MMNVVTSPEAAELEQLRRERAAKRKAFLASKWVRGDDGLEENPLADDTCTTCHGHGILDSGDFGYIPVNCDSCWTTP